MRETTLGFLRIAGLVTLVAGMVAGCADSSWEAVRRRDTVIGYHQFLRDNPSSPYAANARERLAYLRIVKQPMIPPFEEFVSLYPESSLLPDLRGVVEPLYFEVARNANDPDAYREFLQNYPDGALAAKAEGNLAYVENVRDTPNPTRLRDFVESHPESDFVAEAQRTLELIEFRRSTNIQHLAVRVDVAPNVTQAERVRRGFASVVARDYREVGVEVSLVAPGDPIPDEADAWMRIDYHEAPASGTFGGRTLLSHCRVRLYHRETEEPVWDRNFEAPADHVLKGAYGRDKTVFANSKYRFWERFFVPVSTWAVSRSRVQSLSWLEDVLDIHVQGDRAAVLLERGGVDFIDISTPLEPRVTDRYRRESDLSHWNGIHMVDDQVAVIYGPDGAELIRRTELGVERTDSWDSPQVGVLRDVDVFDASTVLMAGSKGLFALRLNQKPLHPQRLLDGDFVGVLVREPHIYVVQPDRVEVATPKHLLRHLTAGRIPLGRSFGAKRVRAAGNSLWIFGKSRIVEVSLADPLHPKAVTLLSPEQTGQVSDLATDSGHLFLLGNRGLQVADAKGQWVSDAIQVTADSAVALRGRFAFLVGNRALEVLDLSPYHSAVAAPDATN